MPNTTILSNDHNQELNRIVNLLNGTTTNLKGVLKTSDAGDPPLELDQLSTGPIQKWLQGGILKAQISNAGNYLFNQSGGFIGDQNGNEYLKFITTASAVNEISVTNASSSNRPTVGSSGETNAGLNISPNGSGQVFITGSSPLRLPTGVAPSNDDDAARKKYVDDKAAFFTLTWKIDDPSTFPTTSQSALATVQVPAIASGFLTKMTIIFRSGSHTAGGTLGLIALLDGAEISGGEVQFTDTNNTANTFYAVDFADVAIVSDQSITVYIKTRTGTITERDVSINLHGFQKVKSV